MTPMLEGRTISRVEDLGDHYGTRLHFTDGTYAELEGYGEEGSDVGIELVTPEMHRRRARKAQGERERRRVQRLAWATQTSSKVEMHALMNVVYSSAHIADLYRPA